MRERVKEEALKGMAYVAIMLFYYPVLAAARTFFFKSNEGPGGLVLALFLVVLGILAGVFILKDDEYRFVREPLANAAVLVPILIAVLSNIHGGWLRMLLEVPPAFLLYFLGLRGYSLRYGDVLNRERVNMGIFFLAVALIASSYLPAIKYLQGQFFLYAYLAMAITLLIRNQENLERFLRRDTGSAMIPKNIRGYNAFYVLVVFGLILLLFNFKGIVLFVFDVSGQIIKFVFGIIYKILQLLLPDRSEGARQAAPQKMFPFSVEEDTTHPLLSFLYKVVFYFILLYLLYRLFPLLGRALKTLFRTFMNWIKRFLTRIDSGYARESEDYSDEIEQIKPMEKGGHRNRLKRKIRNLKRDLKSIRDPAEKVRFIYSILLHILMNRNVDIRNTDTTGEILHKARAIAEIDPYFTEVTDIYDTVRYGDRIPDEPKVHRSEEDYEKISGILK
jgi:hypothetical protein